MSESTTRSDGIGICGLLAVLFIVLKLTGNIGWSWWWVLSPIWISYALILTIAAAVIILACIVAAFEWLGKS